MNRTIRCGAFLLAVALAVPAAAETLRLKTGRVLHGDILNADTAGFHIKRFDNGGSLFVPWDAVAAHDVARLRTELVPDTAVVRPTVMCIRVVTDQQSVYEGLKVEETDAKLVLKLGARKIPIPVKSIKHRVEIELDMDVVYTPEELYEMRAAEVDVLTADGNMVLGDYALSLGLASIARTHYEKIKEIDPARAGEIDKLLADFDRRQQEAEVKKLQEDITLLAKKFKFDDAKERLEKLQDLAGKMDPPPQVDVEALAQTLKADEEQYIAKRDEMLKKEIVPAWYATMERLIRRKASERNMTLEMAKGYVESSLESEIKATLASKYDITDEDVDRFWNERQPTKNRTASYGSGTWIIAGGQSGDIQLKVGGSTSTGRTSGGSTSGRSTLDRLLGGRRSSRQRTQRQPQQQTIVYKLDTPEQWWLSVSGMLRADWLEAVFAEKSLKVIQRKERACPRCGGQGMFQRVSAYGTDELPCKRCHGTKNEVTVYYQ